MNSKTLPTNCFSSNDLFAAVALLLFLGNPAASAQNDSLHAKLSGRLYQDSKIEVSAPLGWDIAIETQSGTTVGAILRKGKYILRLCTGCSQASGIAGGRFSEIAALVQPWGRSDWGARPEPCGRPVSNGISPSLRRVDFWYQRDPTHHSKPDEDDCQEPASTETVWYGSFFPERCGKNELVTVCGGYFLNRNWIARRTNDGPFDEMAFGLTYDSIAPNDLPRKDNPELNQILRETSAIVRSIRFKPISESASVPRNINSAPLSVK